MSSSAQRALIPRKRQPRGARRVETIVATAAKLFAARGFDGTSMNAIAKASGMTIGSLYQYFASRDAIIDAVAEHYLETWRGIKAEFMVRVAQATLTEYFREGVGGMFWLFSTYEGVKAFLDADPQRAPSIRAMQNEIEPFVPMMGRYFPNAAQDELVRVTLTSASMARGGAYILATSEHAAERATLIEEIVFAVTSYLTARFGEPCRPPFPLPAPALKRP
jgi:AcrR family transcriptional regulator